MEAQPEKVARRRRKPQPRRIPTVSEGRQQKPIIFGWGADLTQRERDSLKEKIALIAGIALAIAVAALLGWGVLYDNVIHPNQVASQNATPIARVGNYVIRRDYFLRFENFRSNQLNSQLQQLTAQQQQYQANPKKYALQLQQITSQITSIQQTLTTLALGSLNALIDTQTVLQRAKYAGIVDTPKDVQRIMTSEENNFGGPRHFQQFVASSGMTFDELKALIVGNDLQNKLTAKLSKTVKSVQTEVRASHILICGKGDQSCTSKLTPAQAKARAQQLLARIQRGANFAALAKQYSTDIASGRRGGDLGFFPRSQMVAPFANEAYKLKVGQLGLVKSIYGWHIIKVTGRKQVKLTPTELQQQQATAYSNWLLKQQAIIHVQRYVSPLSLPPVATPTAIP